MRNSTLVRATCTFVIGTFLSGFFVLAKKPDSFLGPTQPTARGRGTAWGRCGVGMVDRRTCSAGGSRRWGPVRQPGTMGLGGGFELRTARHHPTQPSPSGHHQPGGPAGGGVRGPPQGGGTIWGQKNHLGLCANY